VITLTVTVCLTLMARPACAPEQPMPVAFQDLAMCNDYVQHVLDADAERTQRAALGFLFRCTGQT
jgi:hypothetical protein